MAFGREQARREEAAMEVVAMDHELRAHDAAEAKALREVQADVELALEFADNEVAVRALRRVRVRVVELRRRDVRENRLHRAFKPAAVALAGFADLAGVAAVAAAAVRVA